LVIYSVMEIAGRLGLCPNNCEFISHRGLALSDPVFSPFHLVKEENATLLGTSLIPGLYCILHGVTTAQS